MAPGQIFASTNGFIPLLLQLYSVLGNFSFFLSRSTEWLRVCSLAHFGFPTLCTEHSQHHSDFVGWVHAMCSFCVIHTTGLRGLLFRKVVMGFNVCTRCYACVRQHGTSVYSLIQKTLGGVESEPMLTPKEKSFLPKRRSGEANPRTQSHQDCESSTLPLSYSGPPSILIQC